MDKSDGWGITAQGEQFVESGVRPSWKFFQSVLEPGKGIQVVQFGGFQQGLNDGGTNAGEFGTCVQPVFLADGDGANGIFNPVVGKRAAESPVNSVGWRLQSVERIEVTGWVDQTGGV